MLTEQEIKQLCLLIVRNDWDEHPTVRQQDFVVSQFQGTAFDSDYKCYRITKGELSLVAKKTNSTEDKLLRLLHTQGVPVPKVYGTLRAPAIDRDMLILFEEYVCGTELYAHKDSGAWIFAAETLAGLHAKFFRLTDQLRSYLTAEEQADAERKYDGKLRNAAGHVGHHQALRRTFQACQTRLQQCPKTLVHGDLFPTNVLLGEGTPVFIDWADGGVLPYPLDVARLTALYDVRDASLMCPCTEEVCKTYYRIAEQHLQLPYERFLNDVYMAQFVELAACYFPPVGLNRHAVHARSPFNQAVENRLFELHRLLACIPD